LNRKTIELLGLVSPPLKLARALIWKAVIEEAIAI
jgi:hypothetical protein